MDIEKIKEIAERRNLSFVEVARILGIRRDETLTKRQCVLRLNKTSDLETLWKIYMQGPNDQELKERILMKIDTEAGKLLSKASTEDEVQHVLKYSVFARHVHTRALKILLNMTKSQKVRWDVLKGSYHNTQIFDFALKCILEQNRKDLEKTEDKEELFALSKEVPGQTPEADAVLAKLATKVKTQKDRRRLLAMSRPDHPFYNDLVTKLLKTGLSKQDRFAFQ